MSSERASAQAVRTPRKIRFSATEWGIIVERASACRQPPARYVRMVSLGAQPKLVRAQANAAVIHELGRIGNSLIALRNHEDVASKSDAVEAVLVELLAAVKRLG